MEPAHLDDRAVIAVSGPEARPFLQGLLTNDVESLSPGAGLYAALLSPQGKILFDFLLTEGDGAVLLDVARSQHDALLKRLRMYKLRAKVEIESREPLGVFLNLTGHPDNRPAPYADRAISFSAPRLLELGTRSIGALAEMPGNLAGARGYHAHRLALGVPEAIDFGSEKIFALDAGLDELHGVSFTKGCYVGQELTSRMHHRATTRKRILTVTADQPLPAIGADSSGGAEIGEMTASYGNNGIALVRLERMDETSGDISVANISVALTRPKWLDSPHGD